MVPAKVFMNMDLYAKYSGITTYQRNASFGPERREKSAKRILIPDHWFSGNLGSGLNTELAHYRNFPVDL